MELINLSDPLIQHKDNNILLQFELASAFTKFCNLKKSQGDLQFAGASTARMTFQGPVYGIIRAVSLVLLYLASSVEYDFIFILV